MVNAIINGILNLIQVLVTIVLLPLDTLISSALPSFNDVLGLVQDFITTIVGFIPWILSWFNFPMVILTYISLYFVFKLSMSITTHGIKLALAWWDKLKL